MKFLITTTFDITKPGILKKKTREKIKNKIKNMISLY